MSTSDSQPRGSIQDLPRVSQTPIPTATPIRPALRPMDINSLLSPLDRSPPVKPPASLALKRSHAQYEDDYRPHRIVLPSFGELLNNSSPDRQLLPPQNPAAYSSPAPTTPGERLPSIQQSTYLPLLIGGRQLTTAPTTRTPPDVPRPLTPRYHYDCDQIREKISQYLESGEMKVTHFQRTVGINSNSYGRFMKLRGPDGGVENQTYAAAHDFFMQRETAGIRPATAGSVNSAISSAPSTVAASSGGSHKRQRTSTISSISSRRTSGELPIMSTQQQVQPGSHSNSTAASMTPPGSVNPNGPADVTTITLPGLLTDSVPVHDSCDEIRRKIGLHLSRPGVTQASFLRTLAAQFHAEERKFQSKQLNTFRSYRGADKGNTSAIFYAAYVYFERLRIREGEVKTAHRLEMERAWPTGFEIKTPGPSQRGLFTGPGEAWHVDELGRYVFSDGHTGTW